MRMAQQPLSIVAMIEAAVDRYTVFLAAAKSWMLGILVFDEKSTFDFFASMGRLARDVREGG
jgi:hypothetical protein